ncbi:MAG: ethanolamine ammonia-lyase subunit EutC [Glaciimonas sp.]|nr:ethanolamine ammonia-lyase subunit EutC [Glaciimonas sp.]
MIDKKSPVIANPWESLRQFTAARIALGRAGVSLPTNPQLAFQLAHAKARDAVHLALDVPQLAQSFSATLGELNAPYLSLHSAAADRNIYLQRPDLGRRLDDASREALKNLAESQTPSRYDLAFVVVDGLSALAIEQNAAPFLSILRHRIFSENWSIAPICIVQQGRVAIGDEVAELLGAKAVVVLIGERPGLSSPDSMGLYLTWMPQVGSIGLTDAGRNCISNVRPAGLRYEEAAYKLHYLLTEANKRQLSGVDLKDETSADPDLLNATQKNFLLK